MQGWDTVLVGRRSSVDTLRSLAEEAANGTGALVLIEGEAGMGKTRVAEAGASIARELGFDVAWGRAHELQQHRPFGPVIDAMGISRRAPDPRRAVIGRLLREHASTESVDGPGQFRVIDALVDLAESLTLEQSLLFVLDDLHWADPASLRVIGALATRLAATRLLVVATFRPVPRSPELEAFLAEWGHQAVRERLQPLTREAAVELATALLGAEPSPEVIGVLGEAGGNPLFVTELLDGLVDQGAIELTDDGAVLVHDEPPATSTLMNAILDRLRIVRGEVTQTLRMASVLGPVFSVSDLSVVARRSAFDLLEPLEEARRAGLLAADGPRLRFRHDLVRDALYGSIPLAARRALHREAGEALAASGAPVSQVAEHMTLGASPGDTAAAAWLAQAGREAMSASPASAVLLFERALALEPPQSVCDDITAHLIVANTWCGRAVEAASLAERALASPASSAVHTRVRLALIHALWLQGRWDRALSVALERCAHPTTGDDERGRLLAETAMARVYLDGPRAGSAQASEALVLGEASGDDVTVCVALNALSICAYFDARFSEAVAFGECAAAVADRSSTDEARRRHPYFMLGLAYVGVDRLADAEAMHRKGRRLGEQLATAWDAAWYQAAAAGRAFFSGDWDDASAEAEAALAMAEETGTYLGRAYAASILGLIGLHRDDVATAKERWGDARGALAASGPQIGGDWVPWLGALVTEAEGEPDQALGQLLSARARFERDGMAASLLRIAADLIRLALALGRRDEAEQMACICSRLCAIAQPVSVRGMVLRCQGLASGDLQLLLDAVSVYRESPRRLERAAAVEDTARALTGAGRSADAVPLLEEALEAYEHAHAVVDEARVLALLRAAGVHKGRRGRRRRPTSGWDSLTESELRVVRLVAHGYSNPTIAATLYVSRHTVETHMRHILAKLGASSRVEVAAQAARRAH